MSDNPSDADLADGIRSAVQALREAIVKAKAAGLEVHPPITLQVWLTTGNPPGEPASWTIKRRTL